MSLVRLTIEDSYVIRVRLERIYNLCVVTSENESFYEKKWS